MQLSLTLTFLFNRYHGRDEGGQDLEWPPSPLRLFQALIAGSHRGVYGTINQAERDRALRWLATLDPPVIETPAAVESGAGITNWVPNNDNGLTHVRTAKLMLAGVMSADGSITYRWQFDGTGDARVNAEVICAMAELVTHLGQHEDMVFALGQISETPLPASAGKVVHQPQLSNDGQSKAPASGALEAYQHRYQGFLNGESPLDYSIPAHKVRYQQANVISFDAPLALFELWQSEDRRLPPFDPRDLRQPSGMVRNAMIEWLKASLSFRQHYGEEMTTRLICGHEPDQPDQRYDGPHVAFVPIPSFNRDWNADGWIRRVLVIGNGCETRVARDLFDDAVGNLNGRELRDNGRRVGFLRRAESERHDSVLKLFIGEKMPCRVWRTATPIVFTGLTRRGRPAPQLVVRALKQVGIDESDINSVATFSGPILPKTDRALDYRVNGYLDQTPRYHAEVIFNRPVIGPLVIGRGRHSGFGLLFPYQEHSTI